jgi:dTDP-4-amino-4,6-dideoxygalactose transaminase
LFLLEDAAHAHGSLIDGRKAGTLGLAGSFSFYPTKVFVTGEGGMVTTDDEEIYRKALILREHGKESSDENIHTEMGYNWRFSEIHAVLGLLQMKKADAILAERRKIARMYDERFEGVDGITRPEIPPNVESSYYKYILFLDETIDRDSFKDKMDRNCKVKLTGEVYSHPCHSQPVFETYPDMIANPPFTTYPGTEYVSQRHIYLPIYPGLTEEEVDYIVDSVKRTLQ